MHAPQRAGTSRCGVSEQSAAYGWVDSYGHDLRPSKPSALYRQVAENEKYDEKTKEELALEHTQWMLERVDQEERKREQARMGKVKSGKVVLASGGSSDAVFKRKKDCQLSSHREELCKTLACGCR